jgi:hypothetical protein
MDGKKSYRHQYRPPYHMVQKLLSHDAIDQIHEDITLENKDEADLDELERELEALEYEMMM